MMHKKTHIEELTATWTHNVYMSTVYVELQVRTKSELFNAHQILSRWRHLRNGKVHLTCILVICFTMHYQNEVVFSVAYIWILDVDGVVCFIQAKIFFDLKPVTSVT